jgi:nicotinate-nucleotide adenylyltransferase
MMIRLSAGGKRRVGLLGGSFNPAHEGHVHISLAAVKALNLDEVWWLVTPQNPLKSSKNTASLEKRMAHAQALTAPHNTILVSDIERELKTTYTIDTITALQRLHPEVEFVWLMGADNLQQFHRWHRWQAIMQLIPLAIFDRSPFTHAALASKAAQRFRQHRVTGDRMRQRKKLFLPAWSYHHIRLNDESSTRLRKATQWME